MRWMRVMLIMLGLAFCAAPNFGCQNKKHSEIEIETDNAEYELEIETTEKGD